MHAHTNRGTPVGKARQGKARQDKARQDKAWRLTHAGGLATDDGELHVLDLYPHQQEVDLAQHHVLQVVPVFFFFSGEFIWGACVWR